MLLMLLLAQAAVEDAAAPVPAKEARFVTASATGAFLVVAEKAALHVLDGKTLQLVRRLEVAATAVGFDERDETMTVVGDAWLRFGTRDWKETLRAKLPDAEFRGQRTSAGGDADVVFEPGQAFPTSDGAVYYSSRGSHLSRAVFEGGAPKSEALTLKRLDVGYQVERVLAQAGPVLIVQSGRCACVVLDGSQYGLARSDAALGAGLVAGRLAVVRRDGEALYDPRTWKVKWDREAANTAAAFDLRRGRVYGAGKEAIRTWRPDKPEEVETFPGSGAFLAVDGASTRLYGLDGKTVRSWRLKD